MRSVAACVVLAACLTGACAPTGLARTPGGRLYRAKCGSCHVRPESGRFDRGGWVRVLDAHRDRLRLDGGQRLELLEHLAARPAAP